MSQSSRSSGYDPRNNTVSVGGKAVPVPAENLPDAGKMKSSFGSKANAIKEKAIAYNPKLNPKYDARSSISAQAYARTNTIALNPGAGMGHSMMGHEHGRHQERLETNVRIRKT